MSAEGGLAATLMMKAGLLAVAPRLFGWAMWAATHGVVVLEMAGKLPLGTAKGLHHQISATLAKGLKPGA